MGCEEQVYQKGVRTWSRSKCLWESVGLGVENDVEETEVNGLNGERVRCMYSTCVCFGVTGFSSKSASVFTHTHIHSHLPSHSLLIPIHA